MALATGLATTRRQLAACAGAMGRRCPAQTTKRAALHVPELIEQKQRMITRAAKMAVPHAHLLFAVGGAAIETSFSGAYNLAQFFGWQWGKRERPAGASRFTLSWVAIFAVAFLVVLTGYDPVKLTEYSVIFSVVALPLTYLPILLVANDRAYMGTRANGRLANVFGVIYLVILLAVAASAIPLLVITDGGQG